MPFTSTSSVAPSQGPKSTSPLSTSLLSNNNENSSSSSSNSTLLTTPSKKIPTLSLNPLVTELGLGSPPQTSLLPTLMTTTSTSTTGQPPPDYSDGNPLLWPVSQPHVLCLPCKDELQGNLYLKKLQLTELPLGYQCFEVFLPFPLLPHQKPRKDKFLYGHPSGKRFRSPNEFAPHLQFLYAYSRQPDSKKLKCQCVLCSPHLHKHLVGISTSDTQETISLSESNQSNDIDIDNDKDKDKQTLQVIEKKVSKSAPILSRYLSNASTHPFPWTHVPTQTTPALFQFTASHPSGFSFHPLSKSHHESEGSLRNPSPSSKTSLSDSSPPLLPSSSSFSSSSPPPVQNTPASSPSLQSFTLPPSLILKPSYPRSVQHATKKSSTLSSGHGNNHSSSSPSSFFTLNHSHFSSSTLSTTSTRSFSPVSSFFSSSNLANATSFLAPLNADAKSRDDLDQNHGLLSQPPSWNSNLNSLSTTSLDGGSGSLLPLPLSSPNLPVSHLLPQVSVTSHPITSMDIHPTLSTLETPPILPSPPILPTHVTHQTNSSSSTSTSNLSFPPTKNETSPSSVLPSSASTQPSVIPPPLTTSTETHPTSSSTSNTDASFTTTIDHDTSSDLKKSSLSRSNGCGGGGDGVGTVFSSSNLTSLHALPTFPFRSPSEPVPPTSSSSIRPSPTHVSPPTKRRKTTTQVSSSTSTSLSYPSLLSSFKQNPPSRSSSTHPPHVFNAPAHTQVLSSQKTPHPGLPPPPPRQPNLHDDHEDGYETELEDISFSSSYTMSSPEPMKSLVDPVSILDLLSTRPPPSPPTTTITTTTKTPHPSRSTSTP
ncbi:hypothetical protein HMI54_006041, partial [Coelomomyces lativittatus]